MQILAGLHDAAGAGLVVAGLFQLAGLRDETDLPRPGIVMAVREFCRHRE